MDGNDRNDWIGRGMGQMEPRNISDALKNAVNRVKGARRARFDGMGVGARELERRPSMRVETVTSPTSPVLPAPDETVRFPAGFTWGVATAAYQYEGGLTNSTWDRWERQGHIKSGDVCGDACDWWRNAEADLDRAANLGVNALRLSIEWSRLEPRPGVWDASAFKRYREILTELRARGIEPMVTLHHFTDPLWFADRGGFLARDAVKWFTRYAERAIVDALNHPRYGVSLTQSIDALLIAATRNTRFLDRLHETVVRYNSPAAARRVGLIVERFLGPEPAARFRDLLG